MRKIVLPDKHSDASDNSDMSISWFGIDMIGQIAYFASGDAPIGFHQGYEEDIETDDEQTTSDLILYFSETTGKMCEAIPIAKGKSLAKSSDRRSLADPLIYDALTALTDSHWNILRSYCEYGVFVYKMVRYKSGISYEVVYRPSHMVTWHGLPQYFQTRRRPLIQANFSCDSSIEIAKASSVRWMNEIAPNRNGIDVHESWTPDDYQKFY